MGNIYSIDHIAEDHIHTDITCNIEEPQQKYRLGTVEKHTAEEALKHTKGEENTCINFTDLNVARPNDLEVHKTKPLTYKKPAKCYTCGICSKQFQYHGSLASHERAHNRGKRVHTIPLFSALQAAKHTAEESVKHSTREGKIKSNGPYVTHPDDIEFHKAVPSKHKKPLATCGVCRKQFKHDGALVAHEKSHEKPVHTCDICNKTFATMWPLTDHMRMHSGEKPYSCKVCNKTFRNSSKLSSHRRTHSDDKPYHCDICGNSFKRPENLKCHKRIHSNLRPYVCEICGKTLTSSRSLSRHRITHSGETVEKRYGCDFCGKRFHDSSSLKVHRRKHTGEIPFICDYCGKMFGCKGNLEKHIRRIHTGEKPYGCKTCGTKFFDSYTLLLHERIHSGELPYPCGICGKKFRSYSTCRAHMQTHSDERNYVCEICNKRYKRLYHMDRHKQTHFIVPEAVETIVVMATDEDKLDSGWPQDDS